MVVVAAGSATRMGPQTERKPLLELGGRPLLIATLERLSRAESIAELVVVAHADDTQRIAGVIESAGLGPPVCVVAGGATRTASVRCGVAACHPSSRVIGVHDGARPFADPKLVERCLREAAEHGAALLATPVTDTLHRSHADDPELAASTVDREDLWAAQTPQCFRATEFRELLGTLKGAAQATDDVGLWQAAGRSARLVPSTPDNFKITRPDDLLRARALLANLDSPTAS